MNDCLFCKIISGEIPSTKVFEDDQVLAFRDIAPMAPTHILVIPKTHIAGVDEITPENSAIVAHIFEMIPIIAREEGLTGGYRVVSNIGEDGGQTVRHLHFHILGAPRVFLLWRGGLPHPHLHRHGDKNRRGARGRRTESAQSTRSS